jgi:hypothetical protein
MQELHERGDGFEHQLVVRRAVSLNLPAQNLVTMSSGWLKAGINDVSTRLPELCTAAAATFHEIYLRNLSKERTFEAKMEVSIEDNDKTVVVKAVADVTGVKIRHLTGIYKTFQVRITSWLSWGNH